MKLSIGRDFWIFRIGQFISVMGDSCTTLGLSWWILQETNSTMELSSVLAPAIFFRIILLPIMGKFSDRTSRKNNIIASDLIRAILLGVITFIALFNNYNSYLIGLIFILISLASALFYSSESSIIPDIVDDDDKLSYAYSNIQAMNNVARLAGGALAGIIINYYGATGAFVFDSISFLLAGSLMFFVKAKQNNVTVKKPLTLNELKLLFDYKEFFKSFKLLFKLDVIFSLAMIAMIVNFSFAPLITIFLPYLIKTKLSLSALHLGITEAAIALGSIIGSFIIMRVLKRLKNSLSVAIGIGIMSFSFFTMAFSNNIVVLYLACLSIGLFTIFIYVPVRTQMSLSVPNNIRSTIFSTFAFFGQAANPLSIVIVGYLIAFLNIDSAIFLAGLLLFISTIFIIKNRSLNTFLNTEGKDTQAFLTNRYSILKSEVSDNV